MFSKRNTRLDRNFEEFEKGMHFFSNDGKHFDLNELLLCGITIDTVRQIYTGTIEKRLFEGLKHFTEEGNTILNQETILESDYIRYRSLELPCEALALSRMGKTSGYRFKLQNNEIGIVILLGSYYKKYHDEGSHLKIELSPHFIAQRTPKQIDNYLKKIAKCFLEKPRASGIAPHLCVDLQGWEIPNHMTDDIVTRSRFIKDYRGISKLEAERLIEIVTTYNRNETIMVGRSSSLQMSIYRKDIEIIKRDTVDYYYEKWGKFTLGAYNPDKPVTRIEFRFHHSVVNQFATGQNEEITTYQDLQKYLNPLWKYALNTIRYTNKNNVHPVWQYLHDDIEFNDINDIRQEEFKRDYTSKKDTRAVMHNVGLMMGNLLSLHARTARKFKDIQRDIKASPAIIQPLREYFRDNLIDESVYFQHLERKLLGKRLTTRYSIAA